MKPPKIIYVGPHDYSVRLSKSIGSDVFGETDNTDAEITVHPSQSKANLRDTLLHEVLHAVLFVSGLKRTFQWSSETEEQIIRILTPWLLQILQENPELVTYLTKTERNG